MGKTNSDNKRGSGAVSRTPAGIMRGLPSPVLPRLVDTVGAGDCFQVGLFVRLWQNGCLVSRKLHWSLGREAMYNSLELLIV